MEAIDDGAGARTPEELEMLFEDAFITRDDGALAALFEAGAVFDAGDGPPARGGTEIARLATATWADGRTYVADPRRVIQARDIALIVTERSINVVRRGGDGTWRYAIALPFASDIRRRGYEGGTVMRDPERVQTLEPVAVPTSEGEARWWFANLAVIKATAADTGGQMTIVEVTEPPGAAAPLHVHHREDEAFWVLEGDVTIEIGDTTTAAHAGDYVFGPRDIPHRYTVGGAGCRMLFIVTPGGFEDLVIAMSEPAGSRTLPPPPEQEPDWGRIAAIAKAHGCELLA